MHFAPETIVDVVVAIALVAACYSGWRQGAFTAVLSTVGVIAGLILGAALAPQVMQLTESVALRFLLALGTVVMLVGLGNLVGGLLGSSLRAGIRFKSQVVLDSIVGAVFQGLATAIVLWLIAIPLATGLGGSFAQGIRNSHILGAVDGRMPGVMATLPSRISAMLSDSGLPPLVSPFSGQTSTQVEAPRIGVEDTALVEQLRPSVIHVLGESQQCSRRLMGSGFVVDDSHVMTNAHVVAGTDKVSLDTVEGVFEAQVVYYNPELDIAVLYSDHLGLPALAWASDVAQTSEDAIVMGFPESGPFEAAPARIAERITISGPDIYASGRVERESYTVRGTIRQGNSGGPMVNTEGDVLGVVFGASVDNSDIGYALTAQEVLGQVGDYSSLTAPVDPGRCVMN